MTKSLGWLTGKKKPPQWAAAKFFAKVSQIVQILGTQSSLWLDEAITQHIRNGLVGNFAGMNVQAVH